MAAGHGFDGWDVWNQNQLDDIKNSHEIVHLRAEPFLTPVLAGQDLSFIKNM
jgi:hypothetical protein